MNEYDWTPPIDLGDLIVRRSTRQDVTRLCEIYSRPQVCRYQLWTAEQFEAMILAQVDEGLCVVPGVTHEEIELVPGFTFALAIALKDGGEVIGDCQLSIESSESRQGQISFSLDPGYWGRGYAARAVAATLRFGFLRVRLHRIFAATDTRNERSWRLMERVGMRREAHFRHEYLIDGKWIDSYCYAMLETEMPSDLFDRVMGETT